MFFFIDCVCVFFCQLIIQFYSDYCVFGYLVRKEKVLSFEDEGQEFYYVDFCKIYFIKFRKKVGSLGLLYGDLYFFMC